MPGRSPQEAVEAFLAPLRKSTACLTQCQWIYTPPRDRKESLGGLYVATLNRGEPVDLKVGTVHLSLEASIQFTVVERDADKHGVAVTARKRCKVRTRGYMYSICTADETEAVAYHWHPEAKGEVEFPHMHMGSAILRPNGVVSRKNHMPSGRISFEQVIRTLFELGAEPLHDRWEAVLDENHGAFERWKSWG